VQVEEPALDFEWSGQGKHEDEALSGAYVLAGQDRQEGKDEPAPLSDEARGVSENLAA